MLNNNAQIIKSIDIIYTLFSLVGTTGIKYFSDYIIYNIFTKTLKINFPFNTLY